MSATEVLDILALAHALVDSGWTQGATARRGDGMAAALTDPDATRYCLVGALALAVFQQSAPSQERLLDLMAQSVKGRSMPIGFNDASSRRKRDVLRVIERAAAKVGKS